MNKRVHNPQLTLKVLLKNKRMCCVCHSPDKAVQLHHIDGNPANTVENNLAVLCLLHHDQATAGLVKGNVGLGVKLSPTEVRMHKSTWEKTVISELAPQQKTVSENKRRQFFRLFEFEVLRVKNEIMSTSSKTVVKERFRYLVEFAMEEIKSGIYFRKVLLEAFQDIAITMVGDEDVSVPLVNAIRNVNDHLVGPEYVEIDSRDKAVLVKSLAALETIGSYGVFVTSRTTLLRSACRAVVELADIASFYNLIDFQKRAKKTLADLRKECETMTAKEKRAYNIKDKIKLVDDAIRSVSSSMLNCEK